jgi:hypothetical protein
MSNLLLTILDKAGVPQEKVGDIDGAVDRSVRTNSQLPTSCADQLPNVERGRLWELGSDSRGELRVIREPAI